MLVESVDAIGLGRYQELCHTVTRLERLYFGQGDQGSVWMVYGSAVEGSMCERSDIDCLRVDTLATKQGESGAVSRIPGEHDGRYVTIYVSSITEVLEDGMSLKYGGYFACKPLNPHILIRPGMDEVNHPQMTDVNDRESLEAADKTLLMAGGMFLGNFAAAHALIDGRNGGTDQEVVDDALKAFIYVCPGYRRYVEKLTRMADSGVLRMRDINIVRALELAGVIQNEGDRWIYRDQRPLSELHPWIMLAAQNFGATGAVLHDGDIGFAAKYMNLSVTPSGLLSKR